MTSLQQSSIGKVFKPLFSLQLKSNINYLMIGIFTIFVVAIFQYFSGFSAVTSSDGIVQIEYQVISPVLFTFFTAIWAIIFGFSMSKKSVENEVTSFIQNKKTQFLSHQAVIALYGCIIAVIILGAIYSLYILNTIEQTKVLRFMTFGTALLSMLIIWLILFASANLGYAYGLFKNRGYGGRFLIMVLILIIGCAFSSLDEITEFIVIASLVMSLILPIISYQVSRNVGEFS